MTPAQRRLDPPLVGWRRLMVACILTGRLRISLICFISVLSLFYVGTTGTAIDHGCNDAGVVMSLTGGAYVVPCCIVMVYRVVIVNASSDTGVVDVIRKHVATSLRSSCVSHFEI